MSKTKDGCFEPRIIDHDTRRVTAWRSWIARILAKHVEYIAEVEADRMHAQQDVVIGQLRERWQGLEVKVGDCPTSVEVQSHRAIQQSRRRCHTGNAVHVIPEQHFRLSKTRRVSERCFVGASIHNTGSDASARATRAKPHEPNCSAWAE